MARKKVTAVKASKKVVRRTTRATRSVVNPMDSNTFLIIVGGAMIIFVLFFMMFVGHTQPSPKVSGENKAASMEELQPTGQAKMMEEGTKEATSNPVE